MEIVCQIMLSLLTVIHGIGAEIVQIILVVLDLHAQLNLHLESFAISVNLNKKVETVIDKWDSILIQRLENTS